MQRITVDFPDPDKPMIMRISPRVDIERNIPDGTDISLVPEKSSEAGIAIVSVAMNPCGFSPNTFHMLRHLKSCASPVMVHRYGPLSVCADGLVPFFAALYVAPADSRTEA